HLKPGGYLLIETWDCQSFTSRLLKAGWHEYNPPSVLHLFSRRSLETLSHRHGFHQIQACPTFKSVSVAVGRQLLEEKAEESKWIGGLAAALRLLPGHLTIPYPADDLFYAIYQKPTSSSS
ncbi:MAG: methyltransferase domain-containing protein, partial [Verrucomicrobiota bacterium]